LRRAGGKVFGEGALPEIFAETLTAEERRRFDAREVKRWLSAESAYGGFIRERAGQEAAEEAEKILTAAAGRGLLFERTVETAFIVIQR
jgi:hypothetical protein